MAAANNKFRHLLGSLRLIERGRLLDGVAAGVVEVPGAEGGVGELGAVGGLRPLGAGKKSNLRAAGRVAQELVARSSGVVGLVGMV